jgi:hypothetical protein
VREVVALLSGVLPAEEGVAMWKAPESTHDVAMLLGVAGTIIEVCAREIRCLLSERSHPSDTQLLVTDILGVLER